MSTPVSTRLGTNDDARSRTPEPRARTRRQKIAMTLILGALVLSPLAASRVARASDASLDRDVDEALEQLYAGNASARMLRDNAKAVLVFPHILKAGFMFGGQIGDGALRRGGKTVGYYNSVAASYGFQAGIQKFGYALFFMTDSALAYLDKSAGFELGVGPSIVVVDAGVAKSMTTSTLTQEIYAIVFDQKGLMGGVGIQGSKITRISD
jgi:lipid-binding SYLF domain-containing protein